jgi:TatD DNase family protein
MARRALDIGFHVSLAGIVTFPRALELKEVARMVPLDRMLIETDSPFLAPVPYRGKRNEPARVARVAEVIGELRATNLDAIITATGANFERLFVP